MFSAVLMDGFQDSDTGFTIRYHIVCKLFILSRRLQAKSTGQADVLDKLLNTDDMHKSMDNDIDMPVCMQKATGHG